MWGVVNNADVFISRELISPVVIGELRGSNTVKVRQQLWTHLSVSQFGVLCIDMPVSLTLTPHNTLLCPCGAVQMQQWVVGYYSHTCSHTDSAFACVLRVAQAHTHVHILQYRGMYNQLAQSSKTGRLWSATVEQQKALTSPRETVTAQFWAERKFLRDRKCFVVAGLKPQHLCD